MQFGQPDFYQIGIHKRRYSLVDKFNEKRNATQREQIKNRYRQFMHSRKISLLDGSFSPQSRRMDKPDDLENTMPSIRQIREQRDQIRQSLRQTITKYNYANQQKERKLQYLNRKKIKYEKVLQIRQQHNKQKMRLNQSRLSMTRQITEEKLRLKHLVDKDKILSDQSRLKLMSLKKQLGDSRRQEQTNNKEKIKENRGKQLEISKKMHQSIALQQKKLKIKRLVMQKKQRRINTEHYFDKVSNQLKKCEQLQKKQQKSKSELSEKIGKIQKKKQQMIEQLKNYQKILKDGSTLRKQRPKLRLSNIKNQQIKRQFSLRVKSTSQMDDSFY